MAFRDVLASTSKAEVVTFDAIYVKNIVND